MGLSDLDVSRSFCGKTCCHFLGVNDVGVSVWSELWLWPSWGMTFVHVLYEIPMIGAGSVCGGTYRGAKSHDVLGKTSTNSEHQLKRNPTSINLSQTFKKLLGQ